MDAERYEMTADDVARFRTKVDDSGGPDACHIWRSATDGKYGLFKLRGRGLKAHMVAWVLAGEAPPSEGRIIRHVKCRTKLCVNRRHMAEGTHQDNADDRERDGTTARGPTSGVGHPGSQHYRAKLTEADVLAIRASRLGRTVLAETYGVTVNCIGDIITRRRWKHI